MHLFIMVLHFFCTLTVLYRSVGWVYGCSMLFVRVRVLFRAGEVHHNAVFAEDVELKYTPYGIPLAYTTAYKK